MGIIGRILGNLKNKGGSLADRMSARAFDMDNRFRNSNDMRERMPLPNMPTIDKGISTPSGPYLEAAISLPKGKSSSGISGI